MGHILLTAMVNFSGKFSCAIEGKVKTNFTLTLAELRIIALLLLRSIHYDVWNNIPWVSGCGKNVFVYVPCAYDLILEKRNI